MIFLGNPPQDPDNPEHADQYRSDGEDAGGDDIRLARPEANLP